VGDAVVDDPAQHFTLLGAQMKRRRVACSARRLVRMGRAAASTIARRAGEAALIVVIGIEAQQLVCFEQAVGTGLVIEVRQAQLQGQELGAGYVAADQGTRDTVKHALARTDVDLGASPPTRRD